MPPARHPVGRCYLGHLSDLHVIDAQSPGRIEPTIVQDHPAWGSAFHPHDPLSPHATAAMVQAFSDARYSPLTGAPMGAAIVTGDSADMHSHLELRWYIDLMDGLSVDPASAGATTVAPFATPSASLPFVALALVSVLACVIALAVVVAALRAAAAGERRLRLRWTDAAASLAVVVAIALAGLAWSWLVTPTVVLAAIVLAGVALGRGAAGFAAFRRSPLRAVVLTLLSLLFVGLLWLGALVLGFFVTGWPAAALTWLALGAVGVLLVCAWTAVARRAADRLRDPA